MNQRLKDILHAIAVSVMLASCSGADIPAPSCGDMPIEFLTGIEADVRTEGDALPADAVIGVSCIRRNTESDAVYNYYFKNLNYSLINGFDNGEIYFWWREPDTEYDFYAFYPIQTQVSAIAITGPVLSYSGYDTDLLAAASLAYRSDYGGLVYLPFHHLLSKIQIVLLTEDINASERFTIRSITLRNVAIGGTAEYDSGSASWIQSSISGIRQDIDVAGAREKHPTLVAAGSNDGLLCGTYFCPTQPTAISMDIVYSIRNSDSSSTANLTRSVTLPNASTWVPGGQYTYLINCSLKEICISASAVIDGWTEVLIDSEKIELDNLNP